MLKQSIRNLYRHELEKEIKDANCEDIKDVLDLLFGTYNNDYCSDLVVKHSYIKVPDASRLQRLNVLWVYPLFVLAIPFRFVMYGDYKVSEDSTLGKVLIKLIGELR